MFSTIDCCLNKLTKLCDHNLFINNLNLNVCGCSPPSSGHSPPSSGHCHHHICDWVIYVYGDISTRIIITPNSNLRLSLYIHTGLCEHVEKEWPWSVMLITRSTLATDSMIKFSFRNKSFVSLVFSDETTI